MNSGRENSTQSSRKLIDSKAENDLSLNNCLLHRDYTLETKNVETIFIRTRLDELIPEIINLSAFSVNIVPGLSDWSRERLKTINENFIRRMTDIKKLTTIALTHQNLYAVGLILSQIAKIEKSIPNRIHEQLWIRVLRIAGRHIHEFCHWTIDEAIRIIPREQRANSVVYLAEQIISKIHILLMEDLVNENTWHSVRVPVKPLLDIGDTVTAKKIEALNAIGQEILNPDALYEHAKNDNSDKYFYDQLSLKISNHSKKIPLHSQETHSEPSAPVLDAPSPAVEEVKSTASYIPATPSAPLLALQEQVLLQVQFHPQETNSEPSAPVLDAPLPVIEEMKSTASYIPATPSAPPLAQEEQVMEPLEIKFHSEESNAENEELEPGASVVPLSLFSAPASSQQPQKEIGETPEIEDEAEPGSKTTAEKPFASKILVVI